MVLMVVVGLILLLLQNSRFLHWDVLGYILLGLVVWKRVTLLGLLATLLPSYIVDSSCFLSCEAVSNGGMHHPFHKERMCDQGSDIFDNSIGCGTLFSGDRIPSSFDRDWIFSYTLGLVCA